MLVAGLLIRSVEGETKYIRDLVAGSKNRDIVYCFELSLPYTHTGVAATMQLGTLVEL